MTELRGTHYGGGWTEEKLHALRAYLVAYRKIFSKNLWAKHYRTIYFDAFAGSGHREIATRRDYEVPSLFEDEQDRPAIESYRAGSPRIALEISPPFNEYVFNDTDPSNTASLDRLKDEYPLLADRITITSQDGNEALRDFCRTTDWSVTRAVVFLDPYGMQVEWSTIESMAATKAIDMWLLFPVGQAIVRLLTRDEFPKDSWSLSLTRTLGTDEWREAFYDRIESDQGELFDKPPGVRRVAELDDIARYFVERLKGVFCGVPDELMYLRNSRGTPLFLLCFAAGNEKGAVPACRIASYLLGKGIR